MQVTSGPGKGLGRRPGRADRDSETIPRLGGNLQCCDLAQTALATDGSWRKKCVWHKMTAASSINVKIRFLTLPGSPGCFSTSQEAVTFSYLLM